MNKILPSLLAGIVVLGLSTLVADAQTGIVKCALGGAESVCTFQDILKLMVDLVEFAIFRIAVPVSVLAFMVAGLQLVWAQEDANAWKKAKDNFVKILIGFALIICSGLIVLTILRLLKVKDGFILPDIKEQQSARSFTNP
ncbi:MAG: hypothetical protein A2542_02120 [Parcubacteria group bacterium RIFOXYD2_FULL_52_8]|nr:MAG: hypothetical protein A2542_02120 [Parcubacteria group bacterium RIFOXYD2_FULL_52_8]